LTAGDLMKEESLDRLCDFIDGIVITRFDDDAGYPHSVVTPGIMFIKKLYHLKF
jgi:hypothetical protein